MPEISSPLDLYINKYGLLAPQQNPEKLLLRFAYAKNPISSLEDLTESALTIISPLLFVFPGNTKSLEKVYLLDPMILEIVVSQLPMCSSSFSSTS